MSSTARSLTRFPGGFLKGAWELTRDTFSHWSDRQAPRLGASVAFYAIFSITPLILMAVTIAGSVLGTSIARIEFLDLLSMLALLFALLMRWLPSQRQSWRSVWGGAVLASVLLECGKELLGLYLGRATFSDAFGA